MSVMGLAKHRGCRGYECVRVCFSLNVQGDKEEKRPPNESEFNCNETERWGNISGISYGRRGKAVDT